MTKEEARKLTQEQAEVMLAFVRGEKIEITFKGGHYYSACQIPRWDWATFDYRVVRQMPSINWDHVHERFKWLAVDKSGRVFLYQERPVYKVSSGFWSPTEPQLVTNAHSFASYSGPEKGGEWAIAQRPE